MFNFNKINTAVTNLMIFCKFRVRTRKKYFKIHRNENRETGIEIKGDIFIQTLVNKPDKGGK